MEYVDFEEKKETPVKNSNNIIEVIKNKVICTNTLYKVTYFDGVGVEHTVNGLHTMEKASALVDELKHKFPGYYSFNIKKIN